MQQFSAGAFCGTIQDLYQREGLSALDQAFVGWLGQLDSELTLTLLENRSKTALEAKDYALFLTKLAPFVEEFIAQLFNIEAELAAAKALHNPSIAMAECKRLFIQRRVLKQVSEAERALRLLNFTPSALENILGSNFTEAQFAAAVVSWLADNAQDKLELAIDYALHALYQEGGKNWLILQTPHKLSPERLVNYTTRVKDGVTMLASPSQHLRNGFALTDDGGSLQQALDQEHFCIFCHHQGKDSCSKGMTDKQAGGFQQNALQATLTGCPLDEHISEMNELKAGGYVIAPLAVVTVDNPMVAGTGHRICNDCMKACIYQKQEPVDIPRIETRVLKDVLALPYGFEIYSLLTRWNPLNLERPLPKPDSGKRVLVVGMGPAGFTLAHHLINDGHSVVAIDGLKIEPLPADWQALNPIKNSSELRQPLDTRQAGGFGGVAEYGITVRWDKNNLTILQMLLQRRATFTLFGGIRFGGTLTVDKAWELGFDHIALAVGAGKPTLLNIASDMAKGVRMAADFLMALQLTGAARADSLANLQIELPLVVIGGGLTAIDAATEALAYYPLQVAKFAARYHKLVARKGEAAVKAALSSEDLILAERFLAHAEALATSTNKLATLQGFGGVKIAYRRRLEDAPSYRLNHEEVALALGEGIEFCADMVPEQFNLDAYGHVQSITCRQHDGTIILPARSVLVAAGSSPNTVLAREEDAYIKLDGKYFAFHDAANAPITPEPLAKPAQTEVMLWHDASGRAISALGDAHPSFAGNVVKAMASAKRAYPAISKLLAKRPRGAFVPAEFFATLHAYFGASVHAVQRLAPGIIEVVIKARAQAETFRPGQFYRLQQFESQAASQDILGLPTKLAMEGLAMTGAWVNPKEGLLAVIVLEMGASTDLVQRLQIGERVVLMGPTGTPTPITSDDRVLLVGGGLGNAVLFSIGKALRAAGSHVTYVAGYKKACDRFKIDDIEQAADQILWCCDEILLPASRPGDLSFHGNVVQALVAHATALQLSTMSRLLVIGSDAMMAAMATAKQGVLAPYLRADIEALASINSPMQCMLKEICAQCLQRHVDPITGKIEYVFSCAEQDQPLQKVDFAHLRARLAQNHLQESLARMWLQAAD